MPVGEGESISNRQDIKENDEIASSSRHPPSPEGILSQASWVAKAVPDARRLFPKAAFFMGDLRDGLPMVSS
jgi:hypothetical protein